MSIFTSAALKSGEVVSRMAYDSILAANKSLHLEIDNANAAIKAMTDTNRRLISEKESYRTELHHIMDDTDHYFFVGLGETVYSYVVRRHTKAEISSGADPYYYIISERTVIKTNFFDINERIRDKRCFYNHDDAVKCAQDDIASRLAEKKA